MKVVRANIGPVFTPTAYVEGVTVFVDNKESWLEDGILRAAKQPLGTRIEPDDVRLERANFGASDRLVWSTGACAIDKDSELTYWKQRYVFACAENALVAIDTQRSLVVTIAVAGLVEKGSFIQGDKLWLHGNAIVAITLAELVALFDRESGPLQIAVTETYPLRRPKRVAKTTIKYVWTDRMGIVLDDRYDLLWVRPIPGAFEGAGVTLYDEIHPSMFRELEIAGHRHVMFEPLPERVFEATLTVGPAIDPAGGPISTGIVPSRQADLDRLFAQRADDLDDVEILVDLLEDSGEPYAAQLHALVAGETTHRREALGILASFLDELQYHRGLPWAGYLIPEPPLDPDIGDAAAADQRLGLIHTLHIGDGPFAVYAKLVSSPRAVGLRHVDVPNPRVLAALIEGKRTQLVQLSNVKFATRAVIDGIAGPTFDNVTHLHTVVELRSLKNQFEFLQRDPAGFFKKKPRHLILTEAFDEPLLGRLEPIWRELPVESLTVDGKLLTR